MYFSQCVFDLSLPATKASKLFKLILSANPLAKKFLRGFWPPDPMLPIFQKLSQEF